MIERHDEKLWTANDVARYLGVPVMTLYHWRQTGYGPKGARVGRYLRYRPEDVRAWFNKRAERAE
nr:helix-turn-helix domain-containing protein [Pseudonocardia nigra]